MSEPAKTPAAATPSALMDELLLVAEKVGQIADRTDKLEREFATQTAPIDASRATIDGAVAALNAALAGVKALNFHVLDNNLGAVSKRVDEVAAQADVALKALESRLGEQARALREARAETARQLSASDAQRMELAQKRELAEQKMAQQVEAARAEFSKRLAELADSIKKFETPRSFNPRGVWNPSETYARLDAVNLNGSSWVSLADNNREKPGKDARNWMLLAQRGAAAGGGGQTPEPASLQPLTAGATIAWDLINPVATVTLGAAANAFSFSNPRAGGTYVLIVKQDSTGSRTCTWPSAVKWPGNTAPVLTTTASRADVFSFVYDGTVYYGSGSQNFVTS